jgi:Bax protein
MSMRSLNVPARGVQLAEGLLAYSIRGKDYVRDIQAMIRSNRLEQLTMAEQV